MLWKPGKRHTLQNQPGAGPGPSEKADPDL